MMGGRRRRPTHHAPRRSGRFHRTALFAVGATALGGLVLALFVIHALEIRSLRRDLEALHAAQEAAMIEQAALRERLAEKDDLAAIEAEARERLGWVMRGEEKVIFIGEDESEE